MSIFKDLLPLTSIIYRLAAKNFPEMFCIQITEMNPKLWQHKWNLIVLTIYVKKNCLTKIYNTLPANLWTKYFKTFFQNHLNLSNQMTPACMSIVSNSFEKLVNQFLKTIQTQKSVWKILCALFFVINRMTSFWKSLCWWWALKRQTILEGPIY